MDWREPKKCTKSHLKLLKLVSTVIGKLHHQKLVHFFRNCVLFFIAVFSYVPVDSLLTCKELNYRSIS